MAKRSNPVMSYIPGKSVIHALTGTTKLVFFLLFTFSSMLTYDTRVLLGLMVISFSCFAVSHIKFKDVQLRFLVFMVVFLALEQLLYFPFLPRSGHGALRHSAWCSATCSGRYDLTREQLFYHFNISLKYFVALPIALLFITATNPSEFAVQPERRGRELPHRLFRGAWRCAISPTFSGTTATLSTAQQARGVELGKKVKLHKRVKNSISVFDAADHVQPVPYRGYLQCHGAAGLRQGKEAHVVRPAEVLFQRLHRHCLRRGHSDRQSDHHLPRRKPLLESLRVKVPSKTPFGVSARRAFFRYVFSVPRKNRLRPFSGSPGRGGLSPVSKGWENSFTSSPSEGRCVGSASSIRRTACS